MRLSELFVTIQGEGPNVGRPTTFVRFGGCNLRCPGWGKGKLPDGTIVDGCDTVYAVYPEWRPRWETTTPNLVYDRVVGLGPRHVCITGGEPLNQRAEELAALAERLLSTGFTIDLFTNGSRLLPPWSRASDLTVVMDYKLPGSGEHGSFLEENWDKISAKDALKFVCKHRLDFDRAMEVIKEQETKRSQWLLPMWYFGVVWPTDKESLTTPVLAQWIFESGRTDCFINVQTHKLIGMA